MAKKKEETKYVRVEDLAKEMGTSGRSLRKRLRDAGISKPGTRWEWKEDDPLLEEIRGWKVYERDGLGRHGGKTKDPGLTKFQNEIMGHLFSVMDPSNPHYSEVTARMIAEAVTSRSPSAVKGGVGSLVRQGYLDIDERGEGEEMESFIFITDQGWELSK